jgi:transglutaminase-like putative cysteine protease
MEKSFTGNAASQYDSQKVRSWDWRAALLIIAIVEISSTRLVITEWVPFLYFTQTIGLMGAILGLALGVSAYSTRTILRLALGYTLILIPAQLLPAIERTDWLWQDLLSLLTRWVASLIQFIKGQPVYDQLFFTSLVTLGYWTIGLCAGYWLIRRRDFLSAILPSGLAMLIIQNFDAGQPTRLWGLGLYVFMALLLLGRMYFLENQTFWKKAHFLVSAETTANLERGVLTVAACAVFIAWSLPGWITSIKPAAQAWHDLSRPVLERLSDAVSALKSPNGSASSGGDFYSGQLDLGQQAAVGDSPVFTVDVTPNDFVPIRNYWKGRSYDLYINGHWTNTTNASQEFFPNTDEVNLEYPDGRNEMQFTFTSNFTKQGLLYAPAETVWVSRQGNIFSTVVSTGVNDVTAWFAEPILSSGNKYKVRALIADPSVEELRAAGTEYPDWVRNKYLQVPENIKPQLQKLAEEISAPYDTPYDKTQAVTSYLRKTIEYDTEITSIPPENKDPVLWVLFDIKKGFCMYYASAETLMLRSIGIPARMAVGFAEGTFDELKERYVVIQSDAHAWPEVYFPGTGWVEFEPTGNQLPLDRPETKDIVSAAETPNLNAAGFIPEATLEPVLPIPAPNFLLTEKIGGRPGPNRTSYDIKALALIGVAIAAGISFLIIRRLSVDNQLPVYLAGRYTRSGNNIPIWLSRWLRWTSLSPMERTFQAVNFSLYWLGSPQPISKTTQERADVLVKRLPSVEKETGILLQEYQMTMFTPQAGNIANARRAAFGILVKTWKIRIKEALQFLDYRYNQLR